MDFMSALRKVVSSVKEWTDDNKVQKVDGKGLSTNDYTVEDKQKVDGMADGLIILDGKLYLSNDGTPMVNSAVTLPEGGTGGGGTHGGSVTLTNKLTSSNITAAADSDVLLRFNYASTDDETGYGLACIYIADTLKTTYKIAPGDNEINVSKYVAEGINIVKLTCMDRFGSYSSFIYTVDIVSLRKHNVYFYNDTELLYTSENISHGSSATYTGGTPVKLGVNNPDEYVFKGWSPLPENITGDTCCYALFKFTGYLFGKLGKTDGEDYGYGTVDNPNWDAINKHWNTIEGDIKAYQSGTLTTDAFVAKYPIGGRMLVPINLEGKNVVADVEIVAHEHDVVDSNNLESSDGYVLKSSDGLYLKPKPKTVPLTFFCADLPNISYYMNINGANEGGWQSSDMRNFVNNDLFNAFPDTLKSIIKPVNKVSDGGTNNRELVTTIDKCWLASYDEVGFNPSSNVVSGQGEAYTAVFTNTDSSRKKYVFNTAIAGRWWLRSSYIGDGGNERFCRVTNTGDGYGDIASNAYHVAFGFCI